MKEHRLPRSFRYRRLVFMYSGDSDPEIADGLLFSGSITSWQKRFGYGKFSKMKTYIALLRGINAGKLRRVEMKRLKALFESLGYTQVSTYINSGNVIFSSDKELISIHKEIETNLKKELGFEIPTLIKTEREIKKIADAIPKEWQNDSTQRSDVAYLFEEIDSKKTLDEIPVKRQYIDIRYIRGAIYWNIDRKNYNKSQLNKLISHELYQMMTVRNVNTARFLAGY